MLQDGGLIRADAGFLDATNDFEIRTRGIDADGVAFSAIQGLYAIVKQELDAVSRRNGALEAQRAIGVAHRGDRARLGTELTGGETLAGPKGPWIRRHNKVSAVRGAGRG